MTEGETLPDHLHPEAALLPWYVNGTLSPTERLQVDRHVSGCSLCRAELDELAGLASDLRALYEAQPAPSPRVAESVKARIAADAADRRRTATSTSVLEALDRWCRTLFIPRWVPSLAVLVLATQTVLLVWLIQNPSQPGAVRSRSVGPAPILLQVEFRADATEEQIRTLLETVHGRVIDGPMADGRYLLEIPSGPDRAAEAIRALQDRTDVVKTARLPGP